jgi:hypothetical protein
MVKLSGPGASAIISSSMASLLSMPTFVTHSGQGEEPLIEYVDRVHGKWPKISTPSDPSISRKSSLSIKASFFWSMRPNAYTSKQRNAKMQVSEIE